MNTDNLNNYNNSNTTFTLTTYETSATDQYGNTYIAVDSKFTCKGCAFYAIPINNCVDDSSFCTAPKRINNRHIIWQKVENLPIINIPINTLRHLFIESLLSIRNGTKRDNYLRLCSNLYINLCNEVKHVHCNGLFFLLATETVKIFCQSWRHYSGNSNFPIPNDLAEGNYLLWEGDNLTYRISLIDHLIEKIKIDEFEQFVIDTINEYIADTNANKLAK